MPEQIIPQNRRGSFRSTVFRVEHPSSLLEQPVPKIGGLDLPRSGCSGNDGTLSSVLLIASNIADSLFSIIQTSDPH